MRRGFALREYVRQHGRVLQGAVTHLHRSAEHTFSKVNEQSLRLVAGLGVEGDAHFGATVRHRSRLGDPTAPNLRQVHLLHGELLEELRGEGFDVQPGDLGENVTTTGLDLPSLPVGTTLRIGPALLALTGRRNPCVQIEAFRSGLLSRLTDRSGAAAHRAGVMAVVVLGGEVTVGDPVRGSLPAGEPVRLRRV